jgi:hypothetical protein
LIEFGAHDQSAALQTIEVIRGEHVAQNLL